jgi:polar amino acid transport system permease protein
MFEDFNRYVLANSAALAHGMAVTVEICACGFGLASALGVLACLLRLYVPPLRPLAVAYIEFCRATPIFIQLLWVAYVWPEVFGFPRGVFAAGVIALAMQSSGYLAETLRSGIEGLPRGEIEAALALGMSRASIMRRIVAPQVLLVMAPAIINQMAVLVKSSTLVSVIAIPDLMYQSLKIVNDWLQPVAVLTTAAALYFLIIFALSSSAERVAERFRRKFGLLELR